MDNLEKTFLKNLSLDNKYPIDILNWYRNLYYKEDMNTERYVVAKAINDLFEELKNKNILTCLQSKAHNN